MACTEIRDKLSSYLEGELAEPDREEVAAHLRGCGACAEELRLLRQVLDGLHEMGEVDPPPELAEKIRAKIDQKTPPATSCRTFWLRTWGAPLAAAAVLLLVFVTTTVLYGPVEKSEVKVPAGSPSSQIAERISPAPPKIAKASRPGPGSPDKPLKPAPRVLEETRLAFRAEREAIQQKPEKDARVSGAFDASPKPSIPVAQAPEARLRKARALSPERPPIHAKTSAPAAGQPEIQEVIIRIHSPAVIEKARAVVLSLGGQPLPAEPLKSKEKEAGGMIASALKKDRVIRAESFSLPHSAYAEVIHHLRELDPQLSAPPALPDVVEPRKAILTIRLEYPPSPVR